MGGFIELSHELEDGMPTYPGFLPPVRLTTILSHDDSAERYEGKAEFHLGGVDMPGNAATYIDAPFHRFREREDLSGVALDRIAGLPGVVVDAPDEGMIELELDGQEVEGAAVLVRTGWSERWGTEAFWETDPYLSASTVDALLERRPALVGVDFRNVDDTTDPARPAHTKLLGAGILIVEALANLAALPRSGFRFFAVPPMIAGGASFPVRAFAELSP